MYMEQQVLDFPSPYLGKNIFSSLDHLQALVNPSQTQQEHLSLKPAASDPCQLLPLPHPRTPFPHTTSSLPRTPPTQRSPPPGFPEHVALNEDLEEESVSKEEFTQK